MPQILPGDTASTVDVIEEGTTRLAEVERHLDEWDGSSSVIVIKIEYQYAQVGGVTPACARCIGAVFARFGSMPIGTRVVKMIRGTSTWSQHSHTGTPSTSCAPVRSSDRSRCSSTRIAPRWMSTGSAPTHTSPHR